MLTASKVRELLEYDPAAGKLYWKHRDGAAAFNSRFAGRRAINALHHKGYRVGSLEGAQVSAHRVAWLHHFGESPEEIDHINGDRSDNRIANLRAVSHQQNNANRKRPCTNRSGHIGVHWDEHRKKWGATIMVNRKSKFIGRFDTIEEAVNARHEAEKQFGFHPNHGRDQ